MRCEKWIRVGSAELNNSIRIGHKRDRKCVKNWIRAGSAELNNSIEIGHKRDRKCVKLTLKLILCRNLITRSGVKNGYELVPLNLITRLKLDRSETASV